MNILENITKTTVILDEEQNQRYLMERIWDETKPIPAVLMLFPCSINPVESDLTTMLVTNNLNRLNFGGVRVINLFTKINCNIGKDDEPTTADNDKIIVETIERSELAIIAYGKGSESNKKVEKRISEVLRSLEPFKDKLMTIQDPRGYKGFHPLYYFFLNSDTMKRGETRGSKRVARRESDVEPLNCVNFKQEIV